jgi:hypothetical protein
MKSILCKNSVERQSWAVGLSFASASLLNLEALHPGGCAWMGLAAEQSFALSATLATVSVLLGSLILTRLIIGSK